jgi:hypothetical protein
MPPYLDACIQACRRQGIVLDTNIFVLFLVGCWNPQLLVTGEIKRLKSYSANDFTLLLALLAPFPKRVVTPGIVTETCNLLDADNRNYHGAVFGALTQVLDNLFESHKSSKLLSRNPAFLQFGLADASVSDLASRGYLVITDDLKLQHFLQTSGRFSLNFTQVRTASWIR